jgi:ABC-type transport system involved in multi-copper enzyme maturation permease subunit
MSALWAIAVITFKEGIRNRAIYGILLLSLLLAAANFFVSGMIMQEVGKVAVDIGLSSISFSGLLLVLFVGVNLIAKDLDRRTIYMVLSRPISRYQYIYGKFFGMLLLVLVATALVSLFSLGAIALIKAGAQDFFPRFAWAPVFLGVGFTTLMLILLTALSFLYASFTSTSFVTFILTIVSYLIGQSISGVKALVEAPDVAGIKVSAFTVKLVQGAYYLFPNLSLFDIKTQAAHGLPIGSSYILWSLVYWFLYTTLTISFAALIFRRREFP